MFLRNICGRLLKSAISFRSERVFGHRVQGILGTYESDELQKWKEKFEELKIPEADISLEYILAHILDKKKVILII